MQQTDEPEDDIGIHCFKPYDCTFLKYCTKNLPRPNIFNVAGVKKFLEGLSYPIYFLDFESFQPAIPLYDNSYPYEQIVFQYSLHYIENKDGELMHKEFLAYPNKDPRRELAEKLCADVPKDVCVVAYNMGFEKGRIKRLMYQKTAGM